MKKQKHPELNRLKGRIREKGESYRSMSDKTGIALNNFSDKLNGYSIFNIAQVLDVCRILDIAPKDIPYFFS